MFVLKHAASNLVTMLPAAIYTMMLRVLSNIAYSTRSSEYCMWERASFVYYIIASITPSELVRVRDAIRQHMIAIIQQIYAHAKCETVML